MKPELKNFKIFNFHKTRCIACKAELQKLTLDTNMVDGVLVCSNQNCPRFGLLTVVFIKLEAKDVKPKKSGDKGVPKKPV
jgi:hypothetical protein